MAASPSSAPNWSIAEDKTIDFSGSKVALKLPGNMSGDYPSTLNQIVNIYDGDLGGKLKRFSSADIWWDYKTRVLLFFPELCGTLKFKMAAMSPGHREANYTTTSALQLGLIDLYRTAYSHDERRVPSVFESATINGHQWLKYINIDERGHNVGVSYATSLVETHILMLSFYISETCDRKDANWYKAAQSDIEKIMSSVNVGRMTEQ